MNDEQRRQIYKAMGEVEAALFAEGDLDLRLRDSTQQLLMAALGDLGDLVKFLGLPGGVALDINGNDCATHYWKKVAVVSLHAIARVREQEAEKAP